MDSNSNLFGTTLEGGPDGAGTVFSIANTSGSASAPTYARTVMPLASFDDTNGNGPFSDLTIDSNGNLYGTTSTGDGTVFEIRNTGTAASPTYATTPTTLYAFNPTDNGGFEPYGGVVIDSCCRLSAPPRRPSQARSPWW
jgi:uncharacterized repeat protein (TIGR03803 family)